MLSNHTYTQTPPGSCDEQTLLAHSAMEATIQQTTNRSLPGTTDSPAIRRARQHKNKLLYKLRTKPNRGSQRLMQIATNHLADLLLSEGDRKWRLGCVKISWQTAGGRLWCKLKNLQGSSPWPALVPNPQQTAQTQLTTFIGRTDPQLTRDAPW